MTHFENDPEGLAMAIRYAGPDWNKPREVVHEVFSQWGGCTWTLSGFGRIINKAIDDIPANCRESAKVEFDGEETYYLKITYVGPESHQTVIERIQRCVTYVREEREKERWEYERLHAKYAPKPSLP